MTEKVTYDELEKRVATLQRELDKQKRNGDINTCLFRISQAVSVASSLDQLFKTIHSALSSVIDTTNFFIALYDKLHDSVTFPYTVDTVDGYYPPVIAISKTESLTAEVIRTCAPVFVTKNDILRKRARSSYAIPACTPSEIWLGVPLITEEELVGVMAVQNYLDPNCYTKADVELMVTVAGQVATVIKRKQVEQALWESEEQFRKLIEGSKQGILIHRGYAPLFVNAQWAAIHGYSKEEVLAMDTLISLISREDQDWLARCGDAHMRGEAVPEDYEYRGVHKDGSRLWLENRSNIVKWKGQEAIQMNIFDITSRKNAEAEKERLIRRLEKAVSEVKTLQGILPICMHCKEIRDDKGYWNRLEMYIETHSEAKFSHGICEKCFKKLYPEYSEQE